MKKRIMVLCLVFIMMLGVSGCMAKESKSINELALEYMESKYGEPFEYVGPAGDSLSGTHELKVKCASLPDPILVKIENYREEERIFLDNYIAVKYKTQTVDYIQKCSSSVFKNSRVFYDVREDGFDLPADVTFQQFLSDSSLPLSITIEINESSFSSRDQANTLAENISDSGVHFRILLIVTSDKEFGVYTETKLQEKIIKRDFVDCAQIKNLDGSYEVSWKEKEL